MSSLNSLGPVIHCTRCPWPKAAPPTEIGVMERALTWAFGLTSGFRSLGPHAGWVKLGN